ncbi:MAG: alpha/beta hydrolase [Steroidobacteraceae bacterium]|nr:alpha/beta hydrolase [Steroidobacteraceae bacterium]
MTQYFDADGLELAYDDVGDGEPVVLLHGFAANRRLNWKLTGWYDALVNAGYRVLAFDARGHGQSAKPTDIEAYRPAGIAGDALRLLDHLGVRRACLFGYSMGGRNAAWLLAHHRRRFRAVVIGGTGLNLLAPADARLWARRGFALTRDNTNAESLAIPAMVPLYQRALRRGGRTGALAACLMGAFPNMCKADFAQVTAPALVACGSRDTLSGSPLPLASSIPGARAVLIPGRNHLSAVTDPFFKGAVLGFLGSHR